MDPRIESVVLGVVSNVLTYLLFTPFQKIEAKPREIKDMVRQGIREAADRFE